MVDLVQTSYAEEAPAENTSADVTEDVAVVIGWIGFYIITIVSS